MNLDQAHRAIMIGIRENVVVNLIGPPGIGKSDKIMQITEEMKCWLNDWRLAQCDPTDIRGIPVPNHEGKRMEWYVPSSLPERGEDGKCVNGPGVLFFDELDKAPVAVKNAALQIVWNRKVGDYELPDDVAIICACNREEDNCFSTPLGSALSGRMFHLEVEHDIDVWIKWAFENDIVEDIIGFLQFKPTMLYENTGHNAYPSPRTWANASKLIKDLGVEDEQLMKLLIAASVGEGVVPEFMAYSKVYKNVNTEEIITKGKIPTMKPDDPSFNYAVTMAVALYTRKKSVSKYKTNIAKFLKEIGSELRVVFFRQQTQQAMIQFSKDPDFVEIIKDIMDTFDI
jgi:hypothetical protein